MRQLLLLFLSFAMATSVSAQETDGHRKHYDDAVNCYVVSKFVASVYRRGGDDWPDNSEAALSVARSYLQILSYHGWRMGMEPEAIMANLERTYADYSEKTLSTLNFASQRRVSSDEKEVFEGMQNDLLNVLINQSNACGGIPVISLPAE